MVVKVFVLGRPGSGKSTVAQMITTAVPEQNREWAAFHISDYGLLYRMFKSNREQDKFYPSQHGGFEVRDRSIYNRALLDVKNMILAAEGKLTKKQIIVIEFARYDYQESLKLLGEDFIQGAYFLFVDAEMSVCQQRILERIEAPATLHDHYVSDNVLKPYREQDGFEYAEQTFSCLKKVYGINGNRWTIIHNSSSFSKEDLHSRITEFVCSLLEEQQEEEQYSDIQQSLPRQIVDYEYQEGLIPFTFAYSSS